MVTATHRRVERGGVLALVLALHGLLFVVWPRTPPLARADGTTPVTVSIRLPLSRPEPAPPVAARTPTAPRATRSTATPPVREATITLAPFTEAAAPAEAAASAAAADAPALDLRLSLPRGSAERGGVRLAPDSMLRQVLNDPRANSQPDPTQALPRAVADAAKGDCAKGDFPGGGMGLLSLPFLAYAVAADHCRPQR